MGLFKKQQQKQKNRDKIMAERVEEFKAEVRKIGQKYGMTIVPISTKYGLEIEIAVLQDKDPHAELPYKTSTPKGSSEAVPFIVTPEMEKSTMALEEQKKNIEEGHSKGLAKKI